MSSRGRGIHSTNYQNQRRRRIVLNSNSESGVTVPVDVPEEEVAPKSEIVSIKLSEIHHPAELVEQIKIEFQNSREQEPEIENPHLITAKSKIEEETRGLLLADLRELIAGTKPIRWFFAGDDVVGGATKAGEDPGFVDLFAERVRWELRRFPDVIVNAGHPDLELHNLGEEFEKKLLDFKPDVLMLMPGRRESRSGRVHINLFRENLRKLVKILRNKGITIVLQTPPPFMASELSHEVLESDYNYALSFYVETIREIASEHEFPLIDHYADWEQLSRELQLSFIDDNTQRITGAGQRRLCSLLLHELDLFDKKSSICRYCYSTG